MKFPSKNRKKRLDAPLESAILGPALLPDAAWGRHETTKRLLGATVFGVMPAVVTSKLVAEDGLHISEV